LKGISRTIGATELALVSEKLEELAKHEDLKRVAREAAILMRAWETVKNSLEELVVVETKA
jgi:hypothetical protein